MARSAHRDLVLDLPGDTAALPTASAEARSDSWPVRARGLASDPQPGTGKAGAQVAQHLFLGLLRSVPVSLGG